MFLSTLDMVPSPSTWNPRHSTLDKKIDSRTPEVETAVCSVRGVKRKTGNQLSRPESETIINHEVIGW